MPGEGTRFGIRHLVDCGKPRHRVPVAGTAIGHVHRCVTVEAGARLFGDGLASSELLVIEHVGMPALLAEIRSERVASPELPKPRVFLEPRLRHDRSWVCVRRR